MVRSADHDWGVRVLCTEGVEGVMQLYIASYFNTRDRLLPYVATLEAMGNIITSTWLKEVPKGDITKTHTGLYTAHELQSFAVRDVLELFNTEAVILDTFDMTPRGGREVEWGAFVFKVVPFGFVVGPKRNVFHELATTNFQTWEECLTYFSVLSAT